MSITYLPEITKAQASMILDAKVFIQVTMKGLTMRYMVPQKFMTDEEHKAMRTYVESIIPYKLSKEREIVNAVVRRLENAENMKMYLIHAGHRSVLFGDLVTQWYFLML